MRGIDIFQNPYYREISTMRGRTMRGLPVLFNYFSIFGAMCPFWQTFMLHIFCKENEHKQKEFHIGFCF